MGKHISTRLAHAGCEVDPATGAVVSPLHLATTFERAPDGSFPHGYLYSRIDNPTRRAFELAMADIEGGASSVAFASGMAASAAVFQMLSPGDEVLLPQDIYYGVRKLAETMFDRWGLAWREVDMGDLDAVESALTTKTKLVWAETPSNPMLEITDLGGLAALTNDRGILLAVDGTWTTPLLQRPLELGADLVVHSVTKYIGGHSDVLGGVVIAREGLDVERLLTVQRIGGAVMDPFSAWLAMRGMRTLAVRIRQQCRTAALIARYFRTHPAVEAVHYPGLNEHPGHGIAKGQMSDFGGMLSVQVRGDAARALGVTAAVEVFRRATSLGGTESLIEHRASVEAQPTRTPENLLRISIGLEHPDDLIADLDQALQRAR
jgi:cystathionine gamma-synthase